MPGSGSCSALGLSGICSPSGATVYVDSPSRPDMKYSKTRSSPCSPTPS